MCAVKLTVLDKLTFVVPQRELRPHLYLSRVTGDNTPSQLLALPSFFPFPTCQRPKKNTGFSRMLMGGCKQMANDAGVFYFSLKSLQSVIM